MATKTFAYNTEPHIAEIGPHLLEFTPEVDGASFAASVDAMQGRMGSERSQEVVAALREFISGLLLPDSREEFAAVALPTRVLLELLEWVTELYGKRPTGPSSASAAPSLTDGTNGTAHSLSKGSTLGTGQ